MSSPSIPLRTSIYCVSRKAFKTDDLNTSYDERVLPSIGNEVLKATVAQFDGMSSASRFVHRCSPHLQLQS